MPDYHEIDEHTNAAQLTIFGILLGIHVDRMKFSRADLQRAARAPVLSNIKSNHKD